MAVVEDAVRSPLLGSHLDAGHIGQRATAAFDVQSHPGYADGVRCADDCHVTRVERYDSDHCTDPNRSDHTSVGHMETHCCIDDAAGLASYMARLTDRIDLT